ncbi:MAG: ABC transporter ATP-binding protein [Moraxella sp.]|nr:ABC transporter ATP-binding protein [Moraxella sp.]
MTHYFEVSNLSASYIKGQPIVNALDFGLAKGEIGCLLGFSGCGKSTVLRCIAGLEPLDNGKILLDEQVLSDGVHLINPALRGIGMVFQDYALFSHLSVADNIGFGLHKWEAGDKARRIQQMLALVDLASHANKRIDELSGGQQQRVALARALAPKPKLLLLDEPFSNLDAMLRQSLASSVRDIIKETDTTAILVTHDQHEAFGMADKVGVMHQGQIEQFATPMQLYHEPAGAFVANFIGEGVLLDGEFAQGVIHTALGSITPNAAQSPKDSKVQLLIRPDDVVHDDDSEQTAVIVSKLFRGANFLYRLQLPTGETVLSLVPSHHDHAIGSAIGIRLDMAHVVLV